MQENLESLLRHVAVPNAERSELLWAEYRSNGSASESAFSTLLAWHGLTIYRQIWGFIRSDAAEDVFQDVLVKLHLERRKLSTFNHAIRWLRTVAIRKCVDANRRESRRKKREAKGAKPQNATDGSNQQLDIQDAISHALLKLSAKQREAIALVYFEELDRQEAAEILGVHRVTLAKWLDESLARLKDLVPLPTVLLAGGSLGVQSALAAKRLPLTSDRFREFAQRVTAQATSPGWAANNLIVTLIIGVVFTSGMAFAGWHLIDDSKSDSKPKHPVTEPTFITARIESTPAKSESATERNLRIFRSEVLPKQLEALSRLVIGDGKVELESVEAYDVRVLCIFKLLHKTGNRTEWISRIEFEHNTRDLHADTRFTSVYFDMFGTGSHKPIDVKRPIILGRNPVTGKEIIVNAPMLETAVKAFELLPHDALSDEELQRTRNSVEVALKQYLGVWYLEGNAARPCKVAISSRNWIEFHSASGRRNGTDYLVLRADTNGRLNHLIMDGKPVHLSSDRHRLVIDAFNECWLREPIQDGKK